MEERILDEEEGRGIRLKRTQDGETDALEGMEDDEVTVEFPDGEYDEDLVGLTPSQLEEELEKRRRAQEEAIAESDRLTREGNALLAEGKYGEAAPLFSQATLYHDGNAEAAVGYACAVTQNFTATEPLYSEETVRELERLEAGRQAVIEHLGERLQEEQRALSAEEQELAPRFEEKQAERREAFAANRKHYVIFASAALFALAVFVIATAISADNLLHTQSSLPIVFTAIFGVLSFLALSATAVFATKLAGAQRLCIANEKLTSTEEGKHLAALRGKLELLDALLAGPQGGDEADETK